MNESVAGPTNTSDGSNAEEARSQSGTKPAAIKDKQCQYCHQNFTSSSLGRHLDQYLFKKKPDGVHDVEEIRRLRSGITRRTTRNSSKRESPDVASMSTTPGKAASIESRSESGPQLNGKSSRTGFQVLLNQPTWHSTGVINDIPNTAQISQLRVPTTGIDYSIRPSDKSTPETTRALELALREVLDNVRAAVSRTESRVNPFDFDLQRQTFPALCLQILPPPPSLFSTHPFATPTSFPLDPPGFDRGDILKQALLVQIQQWKSDQLSVAASAATHQGTGGPNTVHPSTLDPEMIERSAQQHEEMAVRHLELSLNHWMSTSPNDRVNIWQREITRAFAREKEKRQEIEKQLLRTQQEANQLRGQIERLENCQWPREFSIFPPDMLPISHAVSRELAEDSKVIGIESSRWDYDNIVAKWKRVVMHDKSMGRAGSGVATSIFSDNSNSLHSNNNSDNGSILSLNNNRNASNSGGFHYSQHHYGTKPPSPQLNAPVTPDTSATQPYALNSTQSTPYQTRDPNRTDEPFRPPKRRCTSNNACTQSSTHQTDEKTGNASQSLNPQQARPSSSEYSSQQTHSSPIALNQYRSTYPTNPSSITTGTTSPTLHSKTSPVSGPGKDKSYHRPTNNDPIGTTTKDTHSSLGDYNHNNGMKVISRISGGGDDWKFSYINNDDGNANEAANNNNKHNMNGRNGHSNGLEMLMGACSQQQANNVP
ncbi:hypothetical protein PAAG_01183 [Paracoccidioides lutzii Pb01]|uniref:Uncharacterized protein n=1 Tax=Paracoccidioides lutzii (strain ATCC MYA-826 / Pb01) TaxID=502779 RepID=C1GRN8_PARBA|nr:hypothetical protein PAAG_01183 [Paracoccidioides lutzii Pb01]EEH38262.2 hypothetical protein PAAG_01183 [Paracoccidioides lutzii Pb01]